ncbi:MAG TPA: FAD binding domain-containing protein [Burkholderiales bacterium]|nr:FAD binding domain-containing protein [Burkholderiales bacterium]
MMRLPWFDYRAPATLGEAARILANEGPDATLIAGGTDLLPNMKRRQMAPKVLVSLRHIPELKRNGAALGAGITLTEIVRKPHLPRGLRQAAAQVATVHLRNMGTIGGNLCLDTRCTYYNQNYEWRKAIDFCLKKDGDICWVATASKRCVAMSSTDCAPALLAIGAKVKLLSANGEREIALEELYNNDGIDYLRRKPDEILTEITVNDAPSTYWKLRRRGAFDFPVLGVAAAVHEGSARLALGAVASRPFLVDKANDFLEGKELTDEVIGEAGRLAQSRAKPMDNADLDLYWRKDVTAAFVGYALRELRGDDMRETRQRTARYQPV